MKRIRRKVEGKLKRSEKFCSNNEFTEEANSHGMECHASMTSVATFERGIITNHHHQGIGSSKQEHCEISGRGISLLKIGAE